MAVCALCHRERKVLVAQVCGRCAEGKGADRQRIDPLRLHGRGATNTSDPQRHYKSHRAGARGDSLATMNARKSAK